VNSGWSRDREAPPPARRSTPSPRAKHSARHGSSARAEIDPIRLRFWPSMMRLLRPRGDRPEPLSSKNGLAQAPPPARRSTPAGGVAPANQNGSSARAEIDPRPPAACTGGSRLLRPRGDRPQPERRRRAIAWAPPPARRSTQLETAWREEETGSSARAEIDPPRAGRGGSPSRLLRPRGDRPAALVITTRSVAAPPPARRSTAALRGARAGALLGRAGSSARAEIDPLTANSFLSRVGLLRPRGDRPEAPKGLLWHGTAPPPARRSTRIHPLARKDTQGSSARAEIDPS